MERNTETLSTRDLASPNDPAGDVTSSEHDVRDAGTVEGQPEVYDQAAPAARGDTSPRRRAYSAAGRVADGGLRQGSERRGGPAGCRPRRRRRLLRPCGRGRAGELDTSRFDDRIRTSSRRPARRARRPPLRTAGRCFRPTWTPRSNSGGRRSRPGSSTSPEGRSRMPMAWWRPSCSNSQRASPRNGNGSKHNGAVARTSPPRTCESLCSAIGPFSSGCSRPDSQSRILLEAPRHRGARPGVATVSTRRRLATGGVPFSHSEESVRCGCAVPAAVSSVRSRSSASIPAIW